MSAARHKKEVYGNRWLVRSAHPAQRHRRSVPSRRDTLSVLDVSLPDGATRERHVHGLGTGVAHRCDWHSRLLVTDQ